MPKTISSKTPNNSPKHLFTEICSIIEDTKNKVATHINSTITLLYWQIGDHINKQLKQDRKTVYGKEILSSLSLELTSIYGKGYTYSSLTRMSKVADIFDKKIVATMSQQFSWSHFIELAMIEDEVKRKFYLELCNLDKWSVRQLRDKIDKMVFERSLIAKKPENIIKKELSKVKKSQEISSDLVFRDSYILDFLGLKNEHSEKELEKAIIANLQKFILEMGDGFAFLEQQKRISVDGIDYYIDLLFYHRKLKRLVAIDLKLGKFKPEYKGQMELYLRFLQKHEKQKDEGDPIGLLLCSEGNSEHVELLMLDSSDIKVAQYLLKFPSIEWFIKKLEKAIKLAKELR